MEDIKLFRDREEQQFQEDCAGEAPWAMLTGHAYVSAGLLSDSSDVMPVICGEFRMDAGAADLYAMLKATESLERAYIRDWVKASDYEVACEKLISQFKAHFTGSFKDEVCTPVWQF